MKGMISMFFIYIELYIRNNNVIQFSLYNVFIGTNIMILDSLILF